MKSKNTAGILAIFLGGLGLHKFYLGRVLWGFIYLIFCWTFIPAILGLIEGIIYFTMSKDSFDQKYNNIDYKEKRIEAIKSYSYLLKNDLITGEQFNTIKQYISKGDRKIIGSANKIRSYAEIYINGALEDDEWLKISNKLTSH